MIMRKPNMPMPLLFLITHFESLVCSCATMVFFFALLRSCGVFFPALLRSCGVFSLMLLRSCGIFSPPLLRFYSCTIVCTIQQYSIVKQCRYVNQYNIINFNLNAYLKPLQFYLRVHACKFILSIAFVIYLPKNQIIQLFYDSQLAILELPIFLSFFSLQIFCQQ